MAGVTERSTVLGAIAALLLGCGAEAPASKTEPSIVRVATFNAYLNRRDEGGLIRSVSTSDDSQARAVAEIIQRVRPDIVLLQEFDYDAEGRAVRLFQENYLAVAQNGAAPIRYEHVFAGPVNTGVHSGHDLDRNGVIVSDPGAAGYGGDAFGYGDFPGQYGMVLLSRFPIDEEAVRTFQTFIWRDMPGARLPVLPDRPDTPWYEMPALDAFRLSSKSHWDAPVLIGGERLHILAAHPTPPVFDGEEDRNGLRNHDEIRLLADYVRGAGYIYDDAGKRGGLAQGARFLILGDMNADPFDGDGADGAIAQLLDHPLVDAGSIPTSAGAAAQAALQGGVNAAHRGPPEADTSDFLDDPARKGPGNLRLDYALPSHAGLTVRGSGVFWPAPDEPHYELVGPGYPVVSSDHRLVWIDVEIADD